MNFNSITRSKSLNQTVFLLLATVSNIITQIIINALLTRSLSQEDYGNYSYFINLFTLCQTIFNFGFFYTICRLVSTSKDEFEIRIFYYEGLKFLVITSLIMIVSLYIFSFIEMDELKKNGIEYVFWIITPLSFIYLITNYNEQIFLGNNKITELSISRAVPKIIYSIILLVIFILKLRFRVLVFLILYLGSHLVVYSFLIRRMKPISDKQSRFKNIIACNKKFGINIYFGSLMSVGVASLMGLLISNYSANNIELGYYNIALQITIPLTLIPNILSTVLFSEFAKNSTLKNKVILYVIAISIILYSILYFSSDFIIRTIFGESYIPASQLIRILGLGSVMYGIADFFNRYILARGKAIAIRNIAITVGIVYLMSGLLFIPDHLAVGASYAKVLTGVVYLTLEIVCTRFFILKDKI